MASYKKTLAMIIITLCSGYFMDTAFAINQAAKEETTPPDAAGPLTVENIPPISSTLPAPLKASPPPQAVTNTLPAPTVSQ